MQLGVVLRTLGVLCLLFSTTLVPPILVSLAYSDGEIGHFSASFATALVSGLALWWPLSRKPQRIRNRDGFGIVALMWVVMSLLGALPFMLGLDMSFVDALFESTSGFTTTGSTVITGLDALPRSILLYRTEIQWLGGIGVIVFAVALMPMLGVGGMQLYKAETPGPVKDERMTPRIAGTARTLCVVYVLATVACAVSYWLAGMSPFDAIAHSFSTLSTGGYSTHDASLGYFDSAPIEIVAIVFMLVGGISFNAHFVAWHRFNLKHYVTNAQVRAFLIIVGSLGIFCGWVLYREHLYDHPLEALRYGLFETASVITTTGYGIDDFSMWPLALPVLLIFSSFVGGCASSTAGGIKVIRMMIVGKQAAVHVERLIHPQAMKRVLIDGRVLPDSVIEGVWGFFAVYVTVFAILMVLLMMDGMDQVTAFGAIATAINNLGPGLGGVALDFTHVDAEGKLLCSFAMLLGRLEIFTFLVLLTPEFWRR